MKLFVKFFNGLVSIITILVLLSAAVFVVPKAFGVVPFVVQSGSMEPVINTGAVAFINTKDTDIEKDDIVTYQIHLDEEKDVFVTHRVLEIKDEGLVTKGDANDDPDMGIVNFDQIIGTYLFQIPQVGFLLSKFNSKIFIVIAVWILLLNIIAMVLSSLVDKIKKEDEEEKESENTPEPNSDHKLDNEKPQTSDDSEPSVMNDNPIILGNAEPDSEIETLSLNQKDILKTETDESEELTNDDDILKYKFSEMEFKNAKNVEIVEMENIKKEHEPEKSEEDFFEYDKINNNNVIFREEDNEETDQYSDAFDFNDQVEVEVEESSEETFD